MTYTSWIFNDVMMFILLIFTLEAVHAVWKGVRILAWHRNTKKQLCSGEVPIYGQRRTVNLNWRVIFLLLIVIGYCLLSYRDGMNDNIFPFIIVLGILLLIACVVIPLYRPSRHENWALQIGAGLLTPILLVVLIMMLPDSAKISAGDLPLMQSDYMEIEGEPSYVDFGKIDGILGESLYALIEYETRETGEEEPLTNDIRYEIYHTKYPAILNEIWKREITAQEAEKTDAQVWDASAAYKRINATGYTANYWVIYEDTILVFCSDVELDELQIQTICKKLDLN